MFNPAAYSVERPRVVVLGTLLAVVFGLLSWAGLPRQENPTIEDRFASILTHLPGAEPEKVELLVSKVLEDHISELDDVDTIFTRSTEGASFVLVELEKDAPHRQRMQELQDKVREARLDLPAGASEPDVDTRTLRTNTMILALTSAGAPAFVLRHHAKELERDLRLLPGVRVVELLGEPEEEIGVDLDLRRLSRRGVSIMDVVEALSRRNVLLPGGELELGESRYPIQTTGAFDAITEVGTTYLGASSDNLAIRLRDVAAVERRIADPEVRVRWKGEPAVSIALEMLPRRNAIEFGRRVREFIGKYPLPEGMRLEVVADEPFYVQRRLDGLTANLLLGMALVIVLTLAGMGWRSGIVVSLSIPLSMTAAMGLMSVVGMELHQISIAAMVIAVGLLVDEPIVVADNIQRHRDLGATPKEAAIRGLGEIHLAVLAGAATTIAAFIPLALMEGDIGDFVWSIPVAVSLILVSSVTMAHFVTPLLAAVLHGWFRGSEPQPAPWSGAVSSGYRRILDAVVGHPRLVLTLFAGAFVATLLALNVFLLPPVFFPDSDRHQFLVQVYMPPGSPFAETDAVMRQIEEHLAGRAEIGDWSTYVGAGTPKFFINQFTEGTNLGIGMILVNTKTDLPVDATPRLADDLERELKGTIAGPFVRVQRLRQGYGGLEDVNIFVEGDSLDLLRALAVEIRDIVRAVDGTRNVRDSFGYDPITFQARIDAARANLLGISHADVAATLRTALDGVTATTFREEDEEIDIVVRLAKGQRRTVDDLSTLPMHSPLTGGTVPLAHVATITPGFSTRMILRWNRKREANITADVVGRPVVEATQEIERAVRERITLPPGYQISFFGERKEVRESFLSLARAAVLAIFLIYIILVLRFHSLSQPGLIVLAIPMSLIGSIWGLILTANPLGFMAFLGMIALTGVVVNDSIILLDYMNTLRRRGYSLEDAVYEGALTRLRAVTLTTVTTIGGLLPLSLTGGNFFGPFGFTMIFGLAAAMTLTLLVQPAAYLALERRRGREMAAEAVAAG